jgi:hypothetical protein
MSISQAFNPDFVGFLEKIKDTYFRMRRLFKSKALCAGEGLILSNVTL